MLVQSKHNVLNLYNHASEKYPKYSDEPTLKLIKLVCGKQNIIIMQVKFHFMECYVQDRCQADMLCFSSNVYRLHVRICLTRSMLCRGRVNIAN